jgi:hypothetical protein
MHSRIYFLIILMILISQSISSQNSKIVQAFKFTSHYNDRISKLYSVTIELKQGGVDSLNISKYGNIKNDSIITFLTNDSIIEIRSKDKNHLFQQLIITDPTFLQATESYDIPNLTDFSDRYRPEIISDINKFDYKLGICLNRIWPFGIFPFETNKISTKITPFTDLPNPKNSPTNGQLSLMISYPFTENNQTSVRFYFIIRENKTHSPKWRPAGQEINGLAKEFIDEIIKNIL